MASIAAKVAPEAILSPESQKIINELYPNGQPQELHDLLVFLMWKYLCLCFDIPRPSAKEEAIRNRFIEIAGLLGLKHKTDAAGNLVIVAPAAPGFENKAHIVLQGHVDMVCSKTPESTHNFDTDRIAAYITEDKLWIKADNTTLGADNGIGAASALAVLELTQTHPELCPYGQIEGLFTVEEETTMRGALEIDPLLLDRPSGIINMDSEDDKRCCIGCAGGGEVQLTFPLTAENTQLVNLDDAQKLVLDLQVTGLNGGHSGADIDRGRGNAIVILIQALERLLSQHNDICVVNFSAGNAVNAIPRSATARIIIQQTQLATIQSALQAFTTEIIPQFAVAEAAVTHQKELPLDEAIRVCTLNVAVVPVTAPATQYRVVGGQPLQQILALGSAIPHGPIEMIQNEGLDGVATSNSFSFMNSDILSINTADLVPNTGVVYHSFFRAVEDAKLLMVTEQLHQIAAKFPSTIAGQMFNDFPGWTPNNNNALFKCTQDAFAASFGTNHKFDAYAIHAGLESGCIAKQYPGLPQISIGPSIIDAHSPFEKIRIDTVPDYALWLEGIIKLFSQFDHDKVLF